MAHKKELDYLKNIDNGDLVNGVINVPQGDLDISFDEDDPNISPLVFTFSMERMVLTVPFGPEQAIDVMKNLIDYLRYVKQKEEGA